MKIILDKYKVFLPGKNTLSITSESDYVKSRKALLTYFTTGNYEIDNIYVSSRPYLKWYNDLPECIQKISPVSLLAEKFPSVRLPDDLTNDDVIGLDLLNTAIDPTEKDIIKNFLNVVLPQKIENSQLFRYAYEFSEAVLTNRKAFAHRFISVTWKKKLSLALANQSQDIRLVFHPIIELNEAYCLMLAKGIYGSKSDSYRKYWLEDSALEFHKFSISLTVIDKFISGQSPNFRINEKYEVVMERYFEENLTSGTFGLNDLSGYYGAEINALLTISKKIDEATKDELVIKFKSVLTDKQKNALNKLIIPQLQEFPQLDGVNIKQQAETLKQWAVERFIPFKFYYDEARSQDAKAFELIEDNAEKFGDWLFYNLDAILKEDDIYTNIDVVKNVKEQIKDQSSLIWLIIDGFAAQYTGALELILKSNGINRIQTNWSFATLPTITEVAIPITVSGKYSSAISDEDLTDRRGLLKKAFPDKITVYSAKPAEFLVSLNKPFDICCLHVHDIDTEMHKNDNEFYHGRTVEIERLLQKYIEIVVNVIRRNPERKINLLISTDHGATKCLNNAQMVKNPKLEELASDHPHERCIRLTDELAEHNWDRQDLYMLKKGPSRNKYDWVIARGYKYFGRNDSGYRHGGLTPEEVVVPVIYGQLLQLDAIKLSVSPVGLIQFKFGKTERNFKLKIGNRDVNSIHISSVSLLEEKETFFQLPLQIHANADAVLQGTIRLHPRLKLKSKSGVLPLNLAIKYNSLGIQYEDVILINIFTEKDEFETDFL